MRILQWHQCMSLPVSLSTNHPGYIRNERKWDVGRLERLRTETTCCHWALGSGWWTDTWVSSPTMSVHWWEVCQEVLEGKCQGETTNFHKSKDLKGVRGRTDQVDTMTYSICPITGKKTRRLRKKVWKGRDRRECKHSRLRCCLGDKDIRHSKCHQDEGTDWELTVLITTTFT